MRLNFLRILLIIYGLLSLGKQSYAQCPGGAAPQQYSQATTSSIDGDFESYPFDQFDPALGTLIGVDIHAKVTGLIAMTVINYNTLPRSYNVGVYRKDSLVSPGLGVRMVVDTNIAYTTPVIPGSLHPGTAPTYFDRYPNNPGAGEPANWDSRYVEAPVDRDIYQTISDPGLLDLYSGGGTINIDYGLDPGFSLYGGASQAQGIITTYATNIELEVTYTYCPQSVLANGKLSFSISKKNNSNVLLTWIKEKEENNILYVAEVSTNGQDFKSFGNIQSQKPESASTVVKYEMPYEVPANTTGKLYFRIKQIEPTGEIHYSPIRTVTIDQRADRAVSAYPNPASQQQVELRFTTPQKQKLQVHLINSLGQMVESRSIDLNGAQQYQFIFGKAHAAGIYFMRIVNTASQEQQVLKLVIK
ncbi:MAG: choice-of-anchor E domain-containing protein [Agriterribacter sp.]